MRNKLLWGHLHPDLADNNDEYTEEYLERVMHLPGDEARVERSVGSSGLVQGGVSC